MKIINLVQGSKEWNEWRKNGIGASDISVLMGTNKYKTKHKLWNEKCSYVEFFSNEAMEHGVKCEPRARELAEQELGIKLEPVCVEHDQYSIIRASLDCYNQEAGVLVEIKSPYQNPSLKEARMQKDIPAYYLDQLRYQILITRPKRAYFGVYDSNLDLIHLIEVDVTENSYVIAREATMINEALKFWSLVRSGTQPEPEEKDFVVIEDEPELEQLLKEYKEILAREKETEANKKKITEMIFDYGDDGNFMAYGAQVRRIQKPGKYNIERMKEDNLDLSKYIEKCNIEKMKEDGIDVDKYFERPNEIGPYRIYLPKQKS